MLAAYTALVEIANTDPRLRTISIREEQARKAVSVG
jgi:hypothetical protein